MSSLTAIENVSLGFSRQSKQHVNTFRASAIVNMRKKHKSNYYKLLSLESENVGFDEIKRAYRSIALRYHPDVCPPSRKEEFTRMFVELHQAYETLSNPALRREYDFELSLGEGERFRAGSDFSREGWEGQLRELVKRSERRQRKKAGIWRK